MELGRDDSAKGTVYVIDAYNPPGGTYMAYHLARIFHRDFGWPCLVVGMNAHQTEIQNYDITFPTISLEELEKNISAKDILICNPSYSGHMFGLRLPGRKLMYIQGFNTFSLLDCFFDHYVCVSSFVADFVKRQYGIETSIIPAFIQVDRLPSALPWSERPPGSILVHSKNHPVLLDEIRKRLLDRAPEIQLSNVLEPAPHQEFLSRLGSCRYMLAIPPAEGFGLVPLEAMAMGTTIVGFDGFGGREYMQSGVNCLVTSYPDVDGLVERLITVMRNPALAEHLSEAGHATALGYGYGPFHSAWIQEINRFLQS